MEHALFDLLRSTLIPILGTDIAAGTACHVHLGLVGVAAVRAFPDQLAVILNDLDLAVKAALLALIGFGIQLGIHDIVVNELHHLQHSL